MKTFKIVFSAFFVSCMVQLNTLEAQEAKEANLPKWTVEFASDYAGSYSFGDSEGESELYLICSEGVWVAQIRSGEWNKDGSDYIMNYRNLKNIQIDTQGHFKSDSYSGMFVKFTDAEGATQHGLKILEPWTVGLEEDEPEVGQRHLTDFAEVLYGDSPAASYKLLSEGDLKELSKAELQLMRNEIFARYGYIFQEGGTMETYFKVQKWYRGQHKNVDTFLTDIEKENIKRIKQIESLK